MHRSAYVHSSNLDEMRKVVVQVKDEAALRKLSDRLKENGIHHKLWIEQPENFATWYDSRYNDSVCQHSQYAAQTQRHSFSERPRTNILLLLLLFVSHARCSIATKPYVKSEVFPHMKKLQLAR